MKTHSYILTSCFLLPLSLSATTLAPFGCIGLQTEACPGSVEIMSNEPGSLLASSSTAIWASLPNGQTDPFGNPTYVNVQVGSLLSAAYREQPQTDGHYTPVTFYYQLQTLDTLPQAMGGMDVIPDFSLPDPILSADVGMRTDAINAPGFTSSSSAIHSLQMTNTGALLVDFDGTPVRPGTASAILEFRAQYDNYRPGGIAGAFTTQDTQGSRQGYTSLDSSVLLPTTVPEPRTWALMAIGLILTIGGALRKQRKAIAS
jgi:hypothetical protein